MFFPKLIGRVVTVLFWPKLGVVKLVVQDLMAEYMFKMAAVVKHQLTDSSTSKLPRELTLLSSCTIVDAIYQIKDGCHNM